MTSIVYSGFEKRVRELESQTETNDRRIQSLQESNDVLAEKYETLMNKTEKYEALKESTVFSIRLTTSQHLSDSWKDLDKCTVEYNGSVCFDATTCRFTAPVKGHYYMDMGMRQSRRYGRLEIMLRRGPLVKDIYIGETNGGLSVCHKTMILTLNKGDTVHGIVRRLTGSPGIFWCAFHGYLIAAASQD